jgi:integrase
MRYPFTLYKVKARKETTWHARFWDEEAQKYHYSRSTGIPVEGKKERRREAEEAAKKIYDALIIPLIKSKSTINLDTTSSPAPSTEQTHTTTAVAKMPLLQYLESFWTPTSEYANFKRDVQKKPLTNYYIEMNHDDVRRHVEPFPGFSGVTVGSLNKAILKKWLIWLASRKTQRRKKDGTLIEGDTLSSRRANAVLQAVRVAIRWAVDNEEIPSDPFRKLGEVTESMREKGVLTLEERNRLIASPYTDHRTRLVMLLGSLCGLRRGEMRGLQWGDISDGIINVQHNYQDKEGLKLPKYNSVRKVPVPDAVQNILDISYEKAFNTSPDTFILESPINPGKPLNNNFFREGVSKELKSLGISETHKKERFLSCHSLRHTFVTLAQLSGIPDVVISALVGHKNNSGFKKGADVTQTYSHVSQVIDFNEARKQIELSYIPVLNTNEKIAVSQ